MCSSLEARRGGSWLTSTEIYDPITGTWSLTGDLSNVRSEHTAILLPDGRVLVAGGWNGSSYLNSTEVYDPAMGTWSTTAPLLTARCDYKSTLLLDGRVLVVGGEGNGPAYLGSAEVYDRGLGFQSFWQPTLTTVTSPRTIGVDQLQISGSGFRSFTYSETSGGNTQGSATNYPLVKLQRLDNEQVSWLRIDPTSGFTVNSYTSLPITNFQGGPTLVTVFVNGIPSDSKVIYVVNQNLIYLPLLLRRP